ncbi:MAG: DNA polymerase II, partial [Deltaproteobacteria bacterium]|nr:DNA polymerase II [Deltaproteobacteria bacterium]
YQGFILSGTQATGNGFTQLIFKGRLSDGGRFHWTVTRPQIVFFIERKATWTPPAATRNSVKLKSLRGKLVDALYFKTTGDLIDARNACEYHEVLPYEADVNLVSRFLMERFIRGGVCFESDPIRIENDMRYFIDPVVKASDFTPALKMLSIDIECSQRMDLYSIALYGEGLEQVLMLDPSCENGAGKREYLGFPTEQGLLEAFFKIIRDYDPDVFIGWNVIGFDLQWLSRKCAKLGMGLDIGTDGPAQMLEPGRLSNQWIARIPGRAALDGIVMARSAFVKVDDYSLATVSKKVLGTNKLIEKTGMEKVREINRLFKTDKPGLARYNLVDARLVYDIFEKLNFASFAVRKAQLTGLALDRIGGSVAAFDFLYLPRLHRKGYVADTKARPPAGLSPAPGGLVFDSTPGIYENVVVFDFKSLYPSIIRTFSVDPLAANVVLRSPAEPSDSDGHSGLAPIVKGPAGLEFSKDHAILPKIIEELWDERDRAKKAGDMALSQAVKIIMNSFYGVLGTPSCRFFDPRLAGTITRIGHWILNFSRAYIEELGRPVIYGDTDSLFVHLGKDPLNKVEGIAAKLSEGLNDYLRHELEKRFDVESRLHIEFEKVFVRFFMPTIRGTDNWKFRGARAGRRIARVDQGPPRAAVWRPAG